MRHRGTNHRAMNSTTSLWRLHSEFVIVLLLSLTALLQTASAQEPGAAALANSAPLTAEQVVQNLVRMNLNRVQALHTYQGTRTYRADYHGFPGTRSAEMVVSVKYLSPGRKEFAVRSVTGSKVIIDRVFAKLLEAEKEALDSDVQRRSALTEDNYRFTLIGYETGPFGAKYVLQVEPRTKDKFLYRGRIWVDAEDFAVVRLEAEPAKNPSFWTRSSQVEQVYRKVSDFWLPARNHSVTAIRLGGHAELTIEYNDYQITGADPVGNLPPLEAIRLPGTARAQSGDRQY